MKKTITLILALVATFIDAQTVKTISVYQYVKDSFTKAGIPNAKVTLMDETLTVIDTRLPVTVLRKRSGIAERS